MRTSKGRRWAALLLCLTMVFSTVGADSPASGADPDTGLCEHHPAHTAECGYIAPSEGSPCQHVHDERCGYAPPMPGVPCDKGCTDTDGDGVIDHVPGCAYTPRLRAGHARTSITKAAATRKPRPVRHASSSARYAPRPRPRRRPARPPRAARTRPLPRTPPRLRPPRRPPTPPPPKAIRAWRAPVWTSPPRTATCER